MPSSTIQLPSDGSGKHLNTRSRTVGANTVHDQYTIPIDERAISFHGRFQTFRIPGRAGTTGQKLAALHNATGSPVLVDVNRVTVDLAMTAAKAVTVLPPIIRLSRFTALPTGGSIGFKAKIDTTETSDANLTVLQDAASDGTSSATQLAVTVPLGNVLSQEFAPRLITAAGYEMADRLTFFEGETRITLRALEGLTVELIYNLATMNPITDMWIVGFDWAEYLVP